MPIQRISRSKSSFFSLKNFLIALGVLVVLYYSAKIIFKPDLAQYPALNTCFKSSVHQVILCSSSPRYVRLNQISNNFIHSVLISEDDSFYDHKGIDWREFKKSFVKNLKVKKFARGGSTITQQLVKNAYLTQTKSILRKFKEILLAQQIENKYAKAVILEKYLNVIELGKGVFGVKHASSVYFNKRPSELNILESVYLTTLLPNPKVYSQSFYKKTLPNWQSERIATLLHRLLRRKRISEELYSSAKSKISEFPWTDTVLEEFAPAEDDSLDFLNNLESIPTTYEPSSSPTDFNRSTKEDYNSDDTTNDTTNDATNEDAGQNSEEQSDENEETDSDQNSDENLELGRPQESDEDTESNSIGTPNENSGVNTDEISPSASTSF